MLRSRSRLRSGSGVLAAASALALTTLDAGTASAADDPPIDTETADGPEECVAFRQKNERELAKYEKEQPPSPYRYPRETLILGAPWGNFLPHLGHTGELLLATFIPHLGAQARGEAPAALVSWPWSVLVFGPMYACSRKKKTFVVHGHRVHRILAEPMIVSSKLGVGFSVRGGYRFIWHPSSWVVGPGVGLGSTLDIVGNREKFRASLGPEAVLHFGHCCAPSYFTLAFRYDHYFAGTNVDIVGGSLGYTFF